MIIFDNYSHYYDLLYKDKNYTVEVDYVDHLLRHFNGGNNLLEFGCGTGIHAKKLAEKGYLLHGVDTSLGMLKEAELTISSCEKQGIRQKLSFHKGDMRSYRCKKLFDSVISLFHVVGYNTHNHDVCDTFETAHSHLKNGGIFLFDLWYSPAIFHIKPEVKIKKYENENFFINRISNPEHIVTKNTVIVNYEFHIQNKQTKEWVYFTEKHHVRYFSIPEIQYFAQQIGFRFLHAEEWITKELPSENTWGVTFILKKV